MTKKKATEPKEITAMNDDDKAETTTSERNVARELWVATRRIERLETFLRTVADRHPTLQFEVDGAIAFVDVDAR